MKKKTILIVAIVIMLMSFTATASAATVSDILQSLRDANVPEVYVLQAESYMADKTVTSATADAIIVHINNAAVIADGETKLSQLTGEQKSGILTEISAACALLDMTASYVDEALTIKDSTGNIVIYLSAEDAIKQTGYDYNLILYGLGILMIAGISIIVVKKKLANITTE
ncbi:MAG: hypothetical protein JW903_05865 [Clostridia bacterium]|nr:hypothetical protein [Clostridia bacterium]